jgi:hypothetical protein
MSSANPRAFPKLPAASASSAGRICHKTIQFCFGTCPECYPNPTLNVREPNGSPSTNTTALYCPTELNFVGGMGNAISGTWLRAIGEAALIWPVAVEMTLPLASSMFMVTGNDSISPAILVTKTVAKNGCEVKGIFEDTKRWKMPAKVSFPLLWSRIAESEKMIAGGNAGSLSTL